MPDMYKTTIVIWTDYDPSEVELADLAREATHGDAYCSLQRTEAVADPLTDPNPPSAEFFRLGEDDEDDEYVDEDHPAVADGRCEYDAERAADGLKPYRIVE